jgi:uncharacterized protein with PIN domain
MTARFLFEGTLGKLGKWLRLLGFDALGDPGGSRASAAAAAEGRHVLTRTRRRCRMLEGQPFVFIHSNDPFEQLREVILTLGLRPADLRPFSRCLLCNTPTEPVGKERVRHCVPDFVWQSHERFFRCRVCGRIYWSGSHTERGLARVAALFDGLPRRRPTGGSDA